jgi:L-amino acid N-acyltransferase YncA
MIRAATTDDVLALAQVHVASWQETYPGIISAQVLAGVTVERRTEMWQRTLASPNSVLVAEAAGQVVGFCSLGKSRDDGFDLELYTIYLLQAYQKRGLGRDLWQAAVAEARQRTADTLLIWVLAQNPSRKFYEHIGCRLVGTRQEPVFGEMLEEAAYCYDL